MNIKQTIVFRARIAFLVVLLFAFGIVFRIFYVQWVRGDHWRSMARANLLRNRDVPATRGNIYSDNGSLLATSLPYYSVAFDPTACDKKIFNEKIDSLSLMLSIFFKDKSKEEYKRKLTDARADRVRYIFLNRGYRIDYQQKKKMTQWPIFRLGKIKGGVIFEKIYTRKRPFENLGMRTIGFINEDGDGAGLENSFQGILAGVKGKALYRKLAGGHWKPMNDGNEIDPVEGNDIKTTIDINLQDVAETALNKALTYHRADNGCVVLMEVATGHIKAMVNLGSDKQGGYVENLNYAVGVRTDPGSTFKLASYMALLEDQKIQITDSIDTGNGRYKFYDRYMTDSKPGGYGRVTIKYAFEHSSNIAVSKLVVQHFGQTPQRFLEYMGKFGLAAPLNFQIKKEAVPYLKQTTDPTWSGTSLPWLSVGYETLFSPLHILTFYNAVANNGKMIQPIIATEVRRADDLIEEFEPVIIQDEICSESTIKTLRSMLEGVVERGTASNIRNADYKIAGKTGTAQKLKNGKYTQSYYTSFVGYFPADAPKYSCIVVIDDPQGFNFYGSDVAAPVFKEIADKVYARDLNMHKMTDLVPKKEPGIFPLIQVGNFRDLNELCNKLGISNYMAKSIAEDENSKDFWVRADGSNNAIMWRQRKIESNMVPDTRGMTLRDALFVLENKGLLVEYTGRGRVSTQSITPGARVYKGNSIHLHLD